MSLETQPSCQYVLGFIFFVGLLFFFVCVGFCFCFCYFAFPLQDQMWPWPL